MFLKVLLFFFIVVFIIYLFYLFIEKMYDKGVFCFLVILLIYIIFFGGIGFGVYKLYFIFVE